MNRKDCFSSCKYINICMKECLNKSVDESLFSPICQLTLLEIVPRHAIDFFTVLKVIEIPFILADIVSKKHLQSLNILRILWTTVSTTRRRKSRMRTAKSERGSESYMTPQTKITLKLTWTCQQTTA